MWCNKITPGVTKQRGERKRKRKNREERKRERGDGEKWREKEEREKREERGERRENDREIKKECMFFLFPPSKGMGILRRDKGFKVME